MPSLSFRDFESMSFSEARGRVRAESITQQGSMRSGSAHSSMEDMAAMLMGGGHHRPASMAFTGERRPHSRGMSYEELLALDEQNVKIGLTAAQYRRGVATVRAGRGDAKDTDPITQEQFAPGETLAVVKRCGHKFKEAGLKQWLQKEHICPVCRADIRD